MTEAVKNKEEETKAQRLQRDLAGLLEEAKAKGTNGELRISANLLLGNVTGYRLGTDKIVK